MKKIFTFLVAMIATCALWAGNVITYTASEKLTETTKKHGNGLHTNAFNVAITSHTFADSTGTITFARDVTSIGDCAFYYSPNLTSVTIPNSVTKIGNEAFAGCTGITSFIIPDSVKSIGDEAFLACHGLTSITIPNSVKSIGDRAFSCSNLTSITIPNSVTSIGYGAFELCDSLKSVILPDSITSIEHLTFFCCHGLTSFTIPNSVTSIGDDAFSCCPNLASITIPDSLTYIGKRAFYDCASLTSFTIPNSVTSISEEAFSFCAGFTSFTIPNSITSIGNQAFYFCVGLTSITIPNSVTSIGNEAFHYCYDLKTIYNLSDLNIVKGEKTHGYVAYYADSVYTAGHISITSSDLQRGSASVTCDGKTIPNDTILEPKTEITITATPYTGYQFNSWSDGNTDNPRTIALTQDINIVANFGTKMCTLTILSNMEEAADVTGAGTYEYGTSVTCSIDVFSGYNFVKWGDGNTQNPYEFNIYDDMTLYAFFEEEGGAPIAPDSVIVTPTENEANFQWPQVDNAQTYTMTITTDEDTICTLTFNGLGQLVDINFSAPAHGAASATPGFNFTVTGLQPGTTYGYTIVAKDEKGEVLSTEVGVFTTSDLTAFDAVSAPEKAEKVLHDGQVKILGNGRTYNTQGMLLK